VSTPLQPDAELRRLLAGLVEGALSEQEFGQLCQRLTTDPAARRAYRSYMAMVSGLSWECVQAKDKQLPVLIGDLPSLVSPAKPRPAAGILYSATAKLKRPLLWSTLAVGVLFAGYVTVISWNMLGGVAGDGGPRAGAESRQATSNQPTLATITGSENAQWRHQPQAGSPAASAANQLKVARGEPLQLASGIVELQLKQGVKLVVEGPASWTIDDGNRATLTRGKLIATVPHQAMGFTIKTPTTEIVDLGTEFGVEVGDRGETKTHVFRGEIRVERPATAIALAATSIKLTAGQAVSIDRGGKTTFFEPLASTPAEFIRPPAPTAGDEFNPAVLSPYARYVIEQTKPVAYWDFSWYRDSMKIVNDRIAEHPFEQFLPRHVGMLGPSARQGFPGFGKQNPAVSLDAGTAVAQGLVYRSKAIPTAGYTVALWIQPSGDFKQQPHYYVFGNGHAARGPSEGVRDSLLIVGNRNPSQTGRLGFFDGRDASSLPVPTGSTTLAPGKWNWVVLVREPKKASVYLNGKVELVVDSQWSGKPGELFSFGHRVDLFPTIPFQGQLDEATLWDRALGAEEIQKIHHQATGQPAREPGADDSGR
jgi:hypothetical protein